jgi:aryl-alcohol dehydrogenase-like predicted oxidoreductase
VSIWLITIPDSMKPLILGTAAFQQNYGIANKSKNASSSEIQELISYSQINGVNYFDSAPTYHPAEDLLGIYLDQSLEPKVSSKIDPAACESVREIIESVQQSINKLQTGGLDTLYIHDPTSISGTKKTHIRRALVELKELGLIQNIGFSAYTIDDVVQAINSVPEISTIQVPENLADQRLIHSTELAGLKSEGFTFVVRSVFLQGLLLMNPNQVPGNLLPFQEFLNQLNSTAAKEECTVLELCLDYVNRISWASYILVGAINSHQIKQMLDSRKALTSDWLDRVTPIPGNLVDPRKWN